MSLSIYTDGGALGNPGPAASAYIIYKDREIIYKDSEFLGHATNNFAEYFALVLAFEKVKELLKKDEFKNVSRVSVFADSNLMVNQLNGLYRVKNSSIREFVMKIRILENEIGVPIRYQHIYREQNSLADSLVKNILNSKQLSSK